MITSPGVRSLEAARPLPSLGSLMGVVWLVIFLWCLGFPGFWERL